MENIHSAKRAKQQGFDNWLGCRLSEGTNRKHRMARWMEISRKMKYEKQANSIIDFESLPAMKFILFSDKFLAEQKRGKNKLLLEKMIFDLSISRTAKKN